MIKRARWDGFEMHPVSFSGAPLYGRLISTIRGRPAADASTTSTPPLLRAPQRRSWSRSRPATRLHHHLPPRQVRYDLNLAGGKYRPPVAGGRPGSAHHNGWRLPPTSANALLASPLQFGRTEQNRRSAQRGAVDNDTAVHVRGEPIAAYYAQTEMKHCLIFSHAHSHVYTSEN